MTLLTIKSLRIEYPDRHGDFVAVDSLDLSLQRGDLFLASRVIVDQPGH